MQLGHNGEEYCMQVSFSKTVFVPVIHSCDYQCPLIAISLKHLLVGQLYVLKDKVVSDSCILNTPLEVDVISSWVVFHFA